jgi:GNAT superfamily N-acetyltransferase
LADGSAISSGFAVAHDANEVIAVLTEAAAWMATKGTPAWDASVLSEAFVAPLIARSELLVARSDTGIVAVCTLARSDPEFWPDASVGFAAYLHKLAVRRPHAGGVVTPHLIERCSSVARDWGCSMLRLDCHPNLRSLYERLGFSYLDTFHPRGNPSFVVARFEKSL